MKQLFLSIPLLVLACGLSVAQTKSDSASQSVRNEERTIERIVDEDGDGIDDRKQSRMRSTDRRKDRFIDKDGDGICDGREAGLGLGYRHEVGKKSGTGGGHRRFGHGGRR